jgi:hypothetical protein
MFSTTAAITAGGVPSNARGMMSRVSLGWVEHEAQGTVDGAYHAPHDVEILRGITGAR